MTQCTMTGHPQLEDHPSSSQTTMDNLPLHLHQFYDKDEPADDYSQEGKEDLDML